MDNSAQNDGQTGQTDVNQGADASNAPKTVPVENRISELNRKFNGLSGKIDQLISSIQSKPSVDNTRSVDTNDGSSVDQVSQLREELLIEKHRDSFKKATDIFPELDANSETFDEAFFKEVDAMYKQLSSIKDPNAPLKAARLVALDKGKFEQLERDKLLADENRRSRLLSEGSGSPKQSSKPKETVPDNLKTLAGLLKADTTKLKAHMQANASKYKLGE